MYLDDSISSQVPTDPGGPYIVSDVYNLCAVCGTNSMTFDDHCMAIEKDLHNLVKQCQTHECMQMCHKYSPDSEKNPSCQFNLGPGQPCPQQSNINTETGDIELHHLNNVINNFNDTILCTIHCNMDIKFLGSGPSMKAIIYYIMDYITKSALKMHVAYAALEIAVTQLNMLEGNNTNCDTARKAKSLLQKLVFMMISKQELSSQQMASYLLDLKDHFTSHSFQKLYWAAIEKYLNSVGPLVE